MSGIAPTIVSKYLRSTRKRYRLFDNCGELLATRVSILLRSSAGYSSGDVVISAIGTVDAVDRLLWHGGCHFLWY